MTSHIYTHLSDEAFTNASLKVLSFATESRKKTQKKVVSIHRFLLPHLVPQPAPVKTPKKPHSHKNKKSAGTLAENALGAPAVDGSVMLPGVVSRKKQIVPQIMMEITQ